MIAIVEFAGIDGCGKTTVISMLKDLLESTGKKVIVRRFPSSGEYGIKARECISRGSVGEEFSDALRNDLLQIFSFKKKYINDDIVLLDRGLLSYVAYQTELMQKAVESPPINDYIDAVIMLDVSSEEAMARISKRGGKDALEIKGVRFFDAVSKNFKNLLLSLRGNNLESYQVSASMPLEVVAGECKSILDSILSN